MRRRVPAPIRALNVCFCGHDRGYFTLLIHTRDCRQACHVPLDVSLTCNSPQTIYGLVNLALDLFDSPKLFTE